MQRYDQLTQEARWMDTSFTIEIYTGTCIPLSSLMDLATNTISDNFISFYLLPEFVKHLHHHCVAMIGCGWFWLFRCKIGLKVIAV